MIHLITDFSSTSDKQKLFDMLKNLKKVPHVVQIKQVRKMRSMPQLKYYRGPVLNHISAATGMTPDEADFYLKMKFIPVEKTIRGTGEVVTVPGSTGDLNTKEMEEYLERVRIWAIQEIDCRVPLPNEVIE